LTASPTKPRRKRLGVRDQKRLWLLAGGKCQCCKEGIDFTEMQVGHKTAHSHGGDATLDNSVCLCYRCNNVQGTEPWSAYQKFCRKMVLANTSPEKLTDQEIGRVELDIHNTLPEPVSNIHPDPKVGVYFPNFINRGTLTASNIRIYYKVMDELLELSGYITAPYCRVETLNSMTVVRALNGLCERMLLMSFYGLIMNIR
jgi:hypothetical protein